VQRGFNCDVVIWDVAALAQKFRFQEHDVEVVAVAFSQDDRLLATIGCETEQRVFLLDTATGKIVTSCKLPEPQRVTALAWAPASGACYEFATAAAHRVNIWTVDPYKVGGAVGVEGAGGQPRCCVSASDCDTCDHLQVCTHRASSAPSASPRAACTGVSSTHDSVSLMHLKASLLKLQPEHDRACSPVEKHIHPPTRAG